MGWNFPMSNTMAHHGLIMVGSFLGTLIIVERVVVLKKLWLYLFPLINALSLPFFYFQQDTVALVCLIVGSVGLLLVYSIIYSKYKENYILIMSIGGLFLLLGNIMVLAGEAYASGVPYWFAFLLFTIVGERIDLGKFLPKRKWKRPLLWFAFALFIAGLFIRYDTFGFYLSGAGLLFMAIWLLNYDVVNRSMRSHGIHKYVGITLFSGYIWLLITGALMILDLEAVFFYDALLHAFFLGFTFLMIFAHAPIIFPGVMGMSFKPWHWTLYIWVALLNLSLILRIFADIMFYNELRKISGVINGVILLGFFINLIILIRLQYAATNRH